MSINLVNVQIHHQQRIREKTNGFPSSYAYHLAMAQQYRTFNLLKLVLTDILLARYEYKVSFALVDFYELKEMRTNVMFLISSVVYKVGLLLFSVELRLLLNWSFLLGL